MAKGKENQQIYAESDFDSEPAGDLNNITGGNNMAEEKQSFDSLAGLYGIDRAIARGLRTKMKVPADGKVSETDFVKALKEFTRQTPR